MAVLFMSLQPTADAQESPQPRVCGDDEQIWVELPGGREVDLLAASIHRSRLLSQVCVSAECPWEALLAIDTQALQEWLDHVQPGTVKRNWSSACAAAGDGRGDEWDTRHAGACHSSKDCISAETAAARSNAQRPHKVPRLARRNQQQASGLCTLLQVRKM